MSILTSNLPTIDYSFQGQPFCDAPTKSTIELTTMDYAFQGQPFVTMNLLGDAVTPLRMLMGVGL